MEVNVFEAESHADDNLTCKGCGCKIGYCHGETSYCSTCRKGLDYDSDYEDD